MRMYVFVRLCIHTDINLSAHGLIAKVPVQHLVIFAQLLNCAKISSYKQ